ncbi:MAG: hypothetical protein ABIK08_15150 [Pseudomonadota bacterium]
MPSSTAAAWPSPGRFALALIAGFALTLIAAWWWGSTLIEALLPLAHAALDWMDDRFNVRFLGVEHSWQDTVIRLQLGFSHGFVLGGRVLSADPRGSLWVSTPVGSLLQPLVIAPAMAAALPGRLTLRLMRAGLAALLALAFLLIDLPLTLHAAAWDDLAYSLKVTDFSPLLSWYQFSLSGGRLGIGVLMGVVTWKLR